MLFTSCFRIVLRLLPICCLLGVVLPTWSAQQSVTVDNDAWERFGFTTCELPCFAGVTPGKTTAGDTPRLLYQHIPAIERGSFASSMGLNFWATLPEQRLGGFVRYDAGIVTELRLNARIPILHLLNQLGTPECILLNNSADSQWMTVVFWVRAGVSIGAVVSNQERLTHPNTNTLALWVRAVTPNDCALRGARRWSGFAPAWYYERQQP